MSKEALPETVQIPASPYQTAGSFGIVRPSPSAPNTKMLQWHTCRDRFHQEFEPKDVDDFVFCYKPNTAENVIEFMRTVETVLSLPEEDRLGFAKTNTANTLYVRLSPWWKYRVRRSLLTAMLRAGQDYTERTGEGFEKTLKSHLYLSDNQYALDRFLSGAWASKLKSRRNFNGWYQEFHGKTPAQVNEILVKLKKGRKKAAAPEGDPAAAGIADAPYQA